MSSFPGSNYPIVLGNVPYPISVGPQEHTEEEMKACLHKIMCGHTRVSCPPGRFQQTTAGPPVLLPFPVGAPNSTATTSSLSIAQNGPAASADIQFTGHSSQLYHGQVQENTQNTFVRRGGHYVVPSNFPQLPPQYLAPIDELTHQHAFSRYSSTNSGLPVASHAGPSNFEKNRFYQRSAHNSNWPHRQPEVPSGVQQQHYNHPGPIQAPPPLQTPALVGSNSPDSVDTPLFTPSPRLSALLKPGMCLSDGQLGYYEQSNVADSSSDSSLGTAFADQPIAGPSSVPFIDEDKARLEAHASSSRAAMSNASGKTNQNKPQRNNKKYENATHGGELAKKDLLGTSIQTKKRFACGYPGCDSMFVDKRTAGRHGQKHFPNEHFCPNPNCKTNTKGNNKGVRGFNRHDVLRRHVLSKKDTACSAFWKTAKSASGGSESSGDGATNSDSDEIDELEDEE